MRQFYASVMTAKKLKITIFEIDVGPYSFIISINCMDTKRYKLYCVCTSLYETTFILSATVTLSVRSTSPTFVLDLEFHHYVHNYVVNMEAIHIVGVDITR